MLLSEKKKRLIKIHTQYINTKIYTRIYRKETDRQHYLHIKIEHSKSLKGDSSYSQAIRIKRVSSNQVDLNNSLKEMENNFVKQR